MCEENVRLHMLCYGILNANYPIDEPFKSSITRTLKRNQHETTLNILICKT